MDSILALNNDGGEFQRIAQRLEEVMKEMQALKAAIVSPDSLINKNYAELRERVNRQEQILTKQQQFLEALNRREREANIVVLGVPDDNEAMEGATTDQEKLNRIWEKNRSGVEATHRRLGGNAPTGDESTPRLLSRGRTSALISWTAPGDSRTMEVVSAVFIS